MDAVLTSPAGRSHPIGGLLGLRLATAGTLAFFAILKFAAIGRLDTLELGTAIMEAVLAAAVLVWRPPWVSLGVPAVVFTVFAGAAGWRFVRQETCGCFGAFEPSPLLVATGCLLIALGNVAASLRTRGWSLVPSLAGCGVIAASFFVSSGRAVAQDAETLWLRRQIDLNAEAAVVLSGSAGAEGFVVQLGCDSCRALLDELASTAAPNGGWLFVEMPPHLSDDERLFVYPQPSQVIAITPDRAAPCLPLQFSIALDSRPGGGNATLRALCVKSSPFSFPKGWSP